MPSSLVPAGPLFLPGGEPASWAKLPLFARSAAAAPAHHLLATLYAEQAKLSNEMNPKNENSAYHRMDEAGAVALENWGRRLDSWIIEAELRCANECRSSAILECGAPLTRLHRPVQVPVPERQPAGEAGGAPGKWQDRLGMAFALAVGCLFVVACAHIIVGFPWVSVLIGLPYALHVHYKQRD